MKDRGIASAIVFLALAVFFAGGSRTPAPPPADQYLVNDGKIFRLPAAVPGRVETLQKTADGKHQWTDGR